MIVYSDICSCYDYHIFSNRNTVNTTMRKISNAHNHKYKYQNRRSLGGCVIGAFLKRIFTLIKVNGNSNGKEPVKQ